jgi:hypothetical protein
MHQPPEGFQKRLASERAQFAQRFCVFEHKLAFAGPARPLPLHRIPERIERIAEGLRILRRDHGKIASPEFVWRCHTCTVDFVNGHH